jgi:integrase/recombinase XerD
MTVSTSPTVPFGAAIVQDRQHSHPPLIGRTPYRCRLADCRIMTAAPVSPHEASDVINGLMRVAVGAHLARYKGISRIHVESDLNVFLRWCTKRRLDPLDARRVDVELFVRWLQEVRRFKPSTVSRRLSVVAAFYRTCVIDAVLDHSPSRVHAPTNRAGRVTDAWAVSPTGSRPCSPRPGCRLIRSTSPPSSSPFDFALVAMLGLLGLRIFEACGSTIGDLGEEHGHRGGSGGVFARCSTAMATSHTPSWLRSRTER